MTFDPNKHHRRSIRLKDYDYSQAGIYFVTICTYKRQCWFGEIKNCKMYLNHIGKIVADEWLRSSEIRPNFILDEWIIMPNHLHGIVIIQDVGNRNIHDAGNVSLQSDLGARNAPLQLDLGARNAPLRQKSNSLSACIAGFKSAVTKRINLLRSSHNIPIWQRNYYESIIRDEKSLVAVQEYIRNNPYAWETDSNNLQNCHDLEELSLDLLF